MCGWFVEIRVRAIVFPFLDEGILFVYGLSPKVLTQCPSCAFQQRGRLFELKLKEVDVATEVAESVPAKIGGKIESRRPDTGRDLVQRHAVGVTEKDGTIDFCIPFNYRQRCLSVHSRNGQRVRHAVFLEPGWVELRAAPGHRDLRVRLEIYREDGGQVVDDVVAAQDGDCALVQPPDHDPRARC